MHELVIGQSSNESFLEQIWNRIFFILHKTFESKPEYEYSRFRYKDLDGNPFLKGTTNGRSFDLICLKCNDENVTKGGYFESGFTIK